MGLLLLLLLLLVLAALEELAFTKHCQPALISKAACFEVPTRPGAAAPPQHSRCHYCSKLQIFSDCHYCCCSWRCCCCCTTWYVLHTADLRMFLRLHFSHIHLPGAAAYPQRSVRVTAAAGGCVVVSKSLACAAAAAATLRLHFAALARGPAAVAVAAAFTMHLQQLLAVWAVQADHQKTHHHQ